MRRSEVRAWINSVSSIVQSIAVAVGILFAIKQYQYSTQDAANRENDRRLTMAKTTAAAVFEAHEAAKTLLNFDFLAEKLPGHDRFTKEEAFKKFSPTRPPSG